MLRILGRLTFVLSLKLEEAELFAVIRTIDIVIAFLYQVMFLCQAIQNTLILEAFFVCTTCLAVSHKKYFLFKKMKDTNLESGVNFFLK